MALLESNFENRLSFVGESRFFAQPKRLSFNMESQIGPFFCSETALL